MNEVQLMKRLLAILLAALLSLSGCTDVTMDHPETSRVDNDTEKAPSTDIGTEAPDTAVEETEEETTEEIITTEEVKMSTTLRIGSYNIKHGADAGLDLTKIGDVIKAQNLDIVGLQEIDYKTTRANKVDQPAKLAEASGLPYYVFIPAINYQGGKYGTLILSKYPIVSSEVILLTSWDKEGRALGHAVIDVNGRQLDFFNTHLSYEDTALRKIQFEEAAQKINPCEHFILTGDFNTANFKEFEVISAKLINNSKRNYPTFDSGSAIDNIVYTESFAETASGTVTKSFSDHYMLWAEFTWN